MARLPLQLEAVCGLVCGRWYFRLKPVTREEAARESRTLIAKGSRHEALGNFCSWFIRRMKDVFWICFHVMWLGGFWLGVSIALLAWLESKCQMTFSLLAIALLCSFSTRLEAITSRWEAIAIRYVLFLLGWRPSPVGWRPSLGRVEAIAINVHSTRLEPKALAAGSR